jgi:homoserine O-succinyltransferase/O-acetyltransferase
MPLELDPRPAEAIAPARSHGGDGLATLVVGLLNNMPDPALEATENQFAALLDAAAGPLTVKLRLSYLPEVPRGSGALEHIGRGYWPLERLLGEGLDALIVTGTEPRAPLLCDEPYWRRFGEVVAWAQAHTLSSVWSCLAAHAAVQLLDGIPRQRLADKRFGVFDHQVNSVHPLMHGISAPLRMPHSRWNDLPVARLRTAGYSLLSWSTESGADMFVKQRDSLFVFFQGHPEYQRTTLFREYRRDVARYLNGQQESYPPLPPGYLTPAASALLRQFRERALAERSPEVFAQFPMAAADGAQSNWQPSAVRTYVNWLQLLRRTKGAAAGTPLAAQV